MYLEYLFRGKKLKDKFKISLNSVSFLHNWTLMIHLKRHAFSCFHPSFLLSRKKDTVVTTNVEYV